jgi:hypothetical protein
MTNQILDGYNGYAIEAEKKILQLECKVMEFVTLTQKLEDENVRLKALLGDVFPVIDNALNYFYPFRAEDGDNAMDARARLFELRDKLKARIKHEVIE